MDALLDSSLPTSEFLPLLERVLQVLYTSTNNDERNMAQSVLTRLQEDPQSWLRVDKILDDPSSSSTAKFYALQILGDMISYRWKLLPRETCESVRDYVVSKIIELSSSEEMLHRERVYIGKLNLILVQIAKQEWPEHWKTFMSDIVGASKTSTSQCENNLNILALLSEEVFQFSTGQMTQEKTVHLKNRFNDEFSEVFQLCQFVFEQSQVLQQSKSSLLIATLNTLEKFLAWIPLGYIFETRLIEILIGFLSVPSLRVHTLKCLVEIGSLSLGNTYDHRFRFLFVAFMQQIVNIVPLDTNIADAYENSGDETQAFVMDLSLFLCSFLRNHLQHLESADVSEVNEALSLSMKYLIQISTVNDIEVFKTCLEFWHKFTDDLHRSEVANVRNQPLSLGLVTRVGNADNGPRRLLNYLSTLSSLRRVIISRMAKPEEVLIVEDENGELVRETTKDTDAIAIYRTMREVLVSLTHLDPDDTENIMLEKLSLQIDGTDWSWNNLNTLCWAIGSISGAMSEDEEKKFLVTVIKELLQLCEMKRGKDNKAVVASNIMYVVGQYPRFLRAHWKFLKTVVNKLFEFMHETHPGVQDMACDTFLKIAQKCRRKFVTIQHGEVLPFIDEMLINLPDIIAELEPHQIHSFYESCGCIIASHSNAHVRDELVMKLFKLPNESWQELMYQANVSQDVLRNRENMKSFVNILRTNARVASSLGAPYLVQLRWIFPKMMEVYRAYSEMLSAMVSAGGAHQTRSADARNMRAVKKEILRVLEAFLGSREDAERDGGDNEAIMTTVIQPMTEPILQDYYSSLPDARDAEVLSLFAQVVTFAGGLSVEAVRMIYKSLFAVTLEMIKNNFEDYPDARLNFFKLLRAVNKYNFPALFQLDDNPAAAEADFKLVINAIIWAFKHTERNVAETGLVILLELLINVENSAYLDYFYRSCFRLVLNDILSVLTDTLHRPDFKYHAQVLVKLLSVVAEGKVTTPMWNPDNPEEVDMAGPSRSNQAFVPNHLNALLRAAFPNLNATQVERVVSNLFASLNNMTTFKLHLRDFLVQTKEFSSGDNTALYEDERPTAATNGQTQQDARIGHNSGLKTAVNVDDNMTES